MSAEVLTTYSRTDTLMPVLGNGEAYADVHVLTYDYSGPTWLEDTNDANSSAASDLLPIPSVAEADPEGDITYYGCMGQFDYLSFTVATAGVFHNAAHEAQTTGVVWEYWNGAWTDLGETDGTTGYTAAAGTRTVTWTAKIDWLTTEVNNLVMYWVRSRYATADHHVDTAPVITQVLRGGELFVTPYRVRWSEVAMTSAVPILQRTRDCQSDADIDDYFFLTVDSITGGATSSIYYFPWAVSNAAGILTAADDALGLLVGESSTEDKLTFSLFQRDGGVNHYSDLTATTLTLNKYYWIRVFFDADEGATGTLYAYIYYNRERTQLALTITYALPHAASDYTHFSAANSWTGANTGTISGVSGEYYLSTAGVAQVPPSILAESNVSFPITWSQTETCEDFPDELEASPTAAGWTWGVDANCALECPHWPLDATETHCAKVTADVATDDDGVAYHAITSTFTHFIAKATLCLGGGTTGDTTLAASKERVAWGVRESGGYMVACTIQASAGGVYYWRIRTNQTTGVTTQTTYTLSDDTEYSTVLAFAQTGVNGTNLAAHLWVKSPTDTNYSEWTLVESANIASASEGMTMDDIFVGHRLYAVGGETVASAGAIYVKDIQFHDGGTFFPKVCRGGTSDGTLVYAQRVAGSHLADYGNTYMEVYSSVTDGVDGGWTRQDTLGPTALTDYGWLWPIWDGTQWWFFSCIRTATVYSTNVYKTSDLTDITGAADANLVATFSDEWLFPTRMIEAASGHNHILVGVDYKNIDGAGYPSSTTQIAKFAWFDLTDYTLDGLVEVNHCDDIYTGANADGLQQSEPFPYRRPSDSHLCLISRREPVDTTPEDGAYFRSEFLHVATDADGAAWPALGAIWPGTDWMNISASIRAFVFQGYLWCMGRDTQALPWQSLVMKVDPDTLNVAAIKTWTDRPGASILWECGNGDMDASFYQSGVLKLDVSFDLGISRFCRVSTGISAGPTTAKSRSGHALSTIKSISGHGIQGIKAISGRT